MALSYQTYWDTCQDPDSPTATSFSLPDLIDMELQRSLSFDQETPSIDSIFGTSIENQNFSPALPHFDPYVSQNSYPYLYPQESFPEPKPCLSHNLVDFSTTKEKPSGLYDDFIDFSTIEEKLSYLSDGFVDCPTSNEKRLYPSEDLIDFPTSKRKMFRLSDDLVNFSTTVEKLPEFQCQVPPVFSIGSGGGSRGILSAQSVAARQRRRKITERTQELGKLVPGGNKMNTAEMFGAAYNYIKYLQAQVGVLQWLDSTQTQENREKLLHGEVLQKLALSLKVQEKLYSHEKCLIPKQLVESLANDHELQNSKPFVIRPVTLCASIFSYFPEHILLLFQNLCMASKSFQK